MNEIQGQDYFSPLQTKLSDYLETEQLEQIQSAYQLAKQAHEGQARSSGEPYITHPVAVAEILADLRMDFQSIMAALLHDVIEDTDLDKQQITYQFGEKVAELVDGVSKLTQISSDSRAEAQAENLRKMMLAMAKDIRVILIKLADRLHNLRTLDALSREKQRRIAGETLEIFAPIANRLGMNAFKVEFEEIGFSYLYPVRYKVLKEAVRKNRGNRKEIVHATELAIKNRFFQDNIKLLAISGREKNIYSLYKKMRDKDLSLSEIMDVYAIRLIVEDIDTCYRVLGLVHCLFKPMHGRFKDYIAVPKANGYQSLHTTVLGLHGIPIEIQIRTHEIDQMAEEGIAAHWAYKSVNGSEASDIRARKWLKGLLEMQESTGSSLEFIEHVKIDLYPDEVYVFTPSGEILSLPRDSTAVDFAYYVHTDVGNSCIAAKIDRRLVPLSSSLSSGQTVEIITAEGAKPNPAWLSFVVTGKARLNIRQWLKSQKLSESQLLGKKLLDRSLSSLDLEYENISQDSLQRLLKDMNLPDEEELFTDIGMGNQIAQLVARRLAINLPEVEENSPSPLAIKGTEGMVITYAKCCRPIPGDSIIGYLSAGRGIIIHREGCKNISEMKSFPEKYLFLRWSNEVTGSFSVDVRVDVLNHQGALAVIANTLTSCNANIDNVNVDSRDVRHITLRFLIQVENRQHLAQVIKEIRAVDKVTKVSRE